MSSQGSSLHGFAQIAKAIANADRSYIWVVDAQKHELWTLVSQKQFPADHDFMEIRIKLDSQSYAGMAAETGLVFNAPFDVYNSPDSQSIQRSDRKTGYRTCSLLYVPVFNDCHKVIGVINLVNKCRSDRCSSSDPAWPAVPYRFRASFDDQDQAHSVEFAAEFSIALQD